MLVQDCRLSPVAYRLPISDSRFPIYALETIPAIGRSTELPSDGADVMHDLSFAHVGFPGKDGHVPGFHPGAEKFALVAGHFVQLFIEADHETVRVDGVGVRRGVGAFVPDLGKILDGAVEMPELAEESAFAGPVHCSDDPDAEMIEPFFFVDFGQGLVGEQREEKFLVKILCQVAAGDIVAYAFVVRRFYDFLYDFVIGKGRHGTNNLKI
jgi:hypothetical protein